MRNVEKIRSQTRERKADAYRGKQKARTMQRKAARRGKNALRNAA